MYEVRTRLQIFPLQCGGLSPAQILKRNSTHMVGMQEERMKVDESEENLRTCTQHPGSNKSDS